MRWMTMGFAGALAMLLVSDPARVRGADAVEVKVVNYAGLADLLKQHKGKVVVVDFWATFCVPCMKEFPHLVAMHQKYAKDGLVAISVSLDDLSNAETKANVLKFLQKQTANFTNLILDEKPEVWQEKLKVDGPPVVFVFDRDGKWTKFADKFEYADVEKQALGHLKK